jgi:transposase
VKGPVELVEKRESEQREVTKEGIMRRRDYPSDVADAEWKILEPLIPPAKEGGRPRTTDLREVLNAIFFVDRTGCQWRALPHDFPPWSTAWSYFRKGGFVTWVKETLGWDVEIVEHPWSGLRGVWAPKDAVIDWEKIRPSGFHVLFRTPQYADF